jgi:hypothetical protein
VTLEDTIEASRRLDRHLTQARDQTMPEIGGRKFAGDFSGLLGSAKAALATAQTEIAAAAAELVTEIQSGHRASVKALQDETAAVRKGYAELLGNAPPADETTAEKPKAEGT